MPAYWLARAKIIDPIEYKKYNDAARAIWHKYPRNVLAHGGRYEVLEGETIYQRSWCRSLRVSTPRRPISTRPNTRPRQDSGATPATSMSWCWWRA